MNLYYPIIKFLLNTEEYNKYHQYIDEKYLKENYPETSRIYQALGRLHTNPGTYSLDDLVLKFYTEYPNAKQTEYNPIFEAIKSLEVERTSVEGYLNSLRQRQRASEIAIAALGFAEGGTGSVDTLRDLVQGITDSGESGVHKPDDDLFVTDDLDELYASSSSLVGLRWRLDSLNKTLGSLRKGDFGFVFARPETGKTTFLASEVSHMATQTDKPILWFNNEEVGDKVIKRCFQAALGLDSVRLSTNRSQHQAKYRELIGDRIRIVKDGTLTYMEIEKIIERFQPALIIFDQIDKIPGFHEDRNDLELKAIYIWAREIAKKYAPVIAVCQAGGSGENKRWLTMNDVDNSKTGKQGEADWILGIGKVHDEGLSSVRYLQLSKNKLEGDPDTDPERRHDQWEVKIVPNIARYEDFT